MKEEENGVDVVRSAFLVRSEHLNQYGSLFGGDMMAEIDTVAFCLLHRLYRDGAFVTRAAEINFERPAAVGDVIVFEARLAHVGTTSAQVDVIGLVDDVRACRARMTYVSVDRDGRKLPIMAGGGGQVSPA